MKAPILYLLVGSNGAGKSTFVEHVLAPVTMRLEFVKPDDIERLARESGDDIDSYEAARRASARQHELVESRTSFITETVFSHSSKLELIDDAMAAGYLVVLHVVMIPLPLAIARVAERVEVGGHAVPEQKIRELYDRLWELVATAVRRSTEAVIWDNSSLKPFRKVATFDQGRAVGPVVWPEWTPVALRALR